MHKEKKSQALRTLLQKEIVDLDTQLCPKVEEISHSIKHFLSVPYTLSIYPRNKRKYIVLKE